MLRRPARRWCHANRLGCRGVERLVHGQLLEAAAVRRVRASQKFTRARKSRRSSSRPNPSVERTGKWRLGWFVMQAWAWAICRPLTSNVGLHMIFRRQAIALLASSVLLACISPALADSWRFPAKLDKQTFAFGEVRSVVTTDARQDQRFPTFQLEVFKADRRVAIFPGIGFEQLFASRDHKLFLGLSNSGLPGTAAIVFTDNGEVRLLATHGLAKFEYCEESVTLQREWYDSQNPNVRFTFEGDKLGIFLRDCRGQEIELIRAVQQAYGRAATN